VTAALHDLQRIVGQANAFVPDDRSPYLMDATELRGLQGHADAVVLPGLQHSVAHSWPKRVSYDRRSHAE